MHTYLFGILISLLFFNYSCVKWTPFNDILGGGGDPVSLPAKPPPVGTVAISLGMQVLEGQMMLTSDGGFLIGGYQDSANSWLIRIMKTNAIGDISWVKTLVTSDSLEKYNLNIISMCQLQNNDYLLTVNQETISLFRLNSIGNVIWTKTINDSLDDRSSTGIAYENGFVLMRATALYDSTNKIRCLNNMSSLLRIDVNGETVITWTNIDSTIRGMPGRISRIDSFFIYTNLKHIGNQQTSLYIYKIDNNGKTILSKCVWENAGWATLGISTTLETFAGNLLITIPYPGYLIYTDSDGNPLWRVLSFCNSLINTSDGNFAGVNYHDVSHIYLAADVQFYKINRNGDLITNNTYGDFGQDYGMGIVQALDGGFVIAANSGSYSNDTSSYTNIWLFKVDSSGTTIPLN